MTNKEIIDQIQILKKEKDAIILAHNYQLPEIQDIADFAGDSLQLARKAKEITNNIIVFCGVFFMAETAAILNTKKTVLIPDMQAGCPLADFATGEQVRQWRQRYPKHTYVAYINTTADVKAEVDICCTSSNAVKIVNSIDNDKIVFLPDQNLGAYVQKQVNKEMVLWPGYCVVHHLADPQTIADTIEQNPNTMSMAHPECPSNILNMVDEVCSTGQMFDVVEKYPDINKFIVVTEWGMNYALQKRYPDKKFIEPLKRMQCANMKKITLPKLLDVLQNETNRVMVDSDIARRATGAIDKMLAV